MSRFIIAIVIFVMIIIGSTGSVLYVCSTEEKLQILLDDIIEAVYEDNMQLAEELSADFVEKWEKSEPFFITLIRHHNVDEITKYSARLAAYCAYNQKSEAVAEVNMIKAILTHMSDDEKPKLHNLF